eukprot:13183282-Alexandrium_andersonii.AAC.1
MALWVCSQGASTTPRAIHAFFMMSQTSHRSLSPPCLPLAHHGIAQPCSGLDYCREGLRGMTSTLAA